MESHLTTQQMHPKTKKEQDQAQTHHTTKAAGTTSFKE